MSWTSPITWAFKQIPTFTVLNQQLRDNLLLLKTSIADDGRVSGELKNYSENKSAISIASNVLAVDLATGNYFSFTMTANITTMTLSNIPASGKVGSFVVLVTGNGSAFTWSWFASTVKWPGGTAPIRTSVNAKVDVYLFLTPDGGTTWYGFVLGSAF